MKPSNNIFNILSLKVYLYKEKTHKQHTHTSMHVYACFRRFRVLSINMQHSASL